LGESEGEIGGETPPSPRYDRVGERRSARQLLDKFLVRFGVLHALRQSVTDNLLDIASVAEKLGVGERHIRRLVFERRIPYIKWGHLLRFDPADIDDWIDQQRRRPVDVPAPYARETSPARPGRAHR
jgi:excisionase family DNA binding protein